MASWKTWTACAAGFVAAAACATLPVDALVEYGVAVARGGYSTEDRLQQYGTSVRSRLAPAFGRAAVAYPPAEIGLVALKDARRLELYARPAATEPWRHIRDYTILAASGRIGPKLREGDRQVPEGRYRIESLNPNSRYHLALRIGYPNAFDRSMAVQDRRTELGGDIMIHGNAVSVGCIAVGDEAAEDLFVLAALVGIERIDVVLAPTDLRAVTPTADPTAPAWRETLYADIREALREYPVRSR